MYKLLVLDVDGTMTDGKIYMSSNGEVFKTFNIKDGYGIKNILSQLDMKAVIITGRQSDIVSKRAKELDIEYVYQNVSDKIACLKEIVCEQGCSMEQVIYIGDDINDLECMKIAGYSCCPLDAHEEVKKCAGFISRYKGGDGCIREVIDILQKESKRFDKC